MPVPSPSLAGGAGRHAQFHERIADQILAVGQEQTVEAEVFGLPGQVGGTAGDREPVHPDLAGPPAGAVVAGGGASVVSPMTAPYPVLPGP